MSWEGTAGRWVLSGIVALLLWSAVALERPDELSLTVPVVLEHLPPGLAVASAPAAVEVTLSGPRILLARLSLGATTCRLDLSGLGRGTAHFPSLEGALGLDPEVKVARLQPSPVAVTLTPLAPR